MKPRARRFLDKFFHHHHQSYYIQCIIIRKETIAILFEQYLFLISTVGLQALSDNPRRKLTKSVLTDSVVVFPRANSAGSSRLLANWLFSSCKTLLSSKLFFGCNWFLLFLLVYFNEKLPILTHLTLRHRLPVNRVFRICFDPR